MKTAGLHTGRIAKGLALCLIMAIVLAASAFVYTLRLQEIRKWEKQTETYSIVLAESTSLQMDFAYAALGNIAERIQDRWSISAEYLSTKLGTYDFHQFLNEKVALFPSIEVISVLDVDGRVISTSRAFPAPDYSLDDRDYFQVQRDNPVLGTYLSNPVRSKTTGKWLFFLSQRLTGSDGEFIGVATLGISPDFYTGFYQKLGSEGHTSISLLRNDFTFLARWPENDSVMGKRNTTGSTYHLIHDLQKNSGVLITDSARMSDDGAIRTRMAAIQSLKKYPLIVNFSIDPELYLSDWRTMTTAITIVALAAIAAVVAAFRVLIQLSQQKDRDMQVMTGLKREADIINRSQAGLLNSLTEQQKALKDSSDRLQAIFQNAADGIVMIDDAGMIEAMNPAALSILGYSQDALPADSSQFFSSLRQLDVPGLSALSAELSQSSPVRMETECLRKNGTLFPAELSVSEYRLAGQRKIMITMRDISERRKIERMKNEFISTVSHELRTPLTAIRGALGLLTGGAAGDIPLTLSPLISIANKNSETLARLINDLLDIQKIEAGKMDFSFERLNVLNLLDNAAHNNQSLAESQGVRIELDTDPAMPPETAVLVDYGRFQQVMANLISNACKYSPSGSKVRLMAMLTGARNLRVAVSDQGEGVPENFHDRIFNKFSQADSSDTRAKGGTGLGLAISRLLVQQMHGEIGFYNLPAEQGGGAYFFIDLPVADAESA